MDSTKDHIKASILSDLDKAFQEDYQKYIHSDSLCDTYSINTQDLELLISDYHANGYIEKHETGGRTSFLRFSLEGKNHFDEVSRHPNNAGLRHKILELLSGRYEEDVHSIVQDREIAKILDIEINSVHFNLLILESMGTVRLYKTISTMAATLTSEGRVVYEGSLQSVIFLSHAATDKPIAMKIKSLIEDTFPRTMVYASSDPANKIIGSPWLKRILQNLEEASMLLILASERGLSRNWVWFEAGAGWHKFGTTNCLCIGAIRKGKLPPPFTIYEAVNVDDAEDLENLFKQLSVLLEEPESPPDFQLAVRELQALEREAVSSGPPENEAQFPEALKKEVEKGLRKLSLVDKEALRLLSLFGELTEAEIISKLIENGNLKIEDSGAFVIRKIQSATSFVEEVIRGSDRERRLLGTAQPWKIKPNLRDILDYYLNKEN